MCKSNACSKVRSEKLSASRQLLVGRSNSLIFTCSKRWHLCHQRLNLILVKQLPSVHTILNHGQHFIMHNGVHFFGN